MLFRDKFILNYSSEEVIFCWNSYIDSPSVDQLIKIYQKQYVSWWLKPCNKLFYIQDRFLAFNQFGVFDNSSFIIVCICFRTKQKDIGIVGK